MRDAPFHLVAKAVLENMLSETFQATDMWAKLVKLCRPECILDAQLLTSHIFLQVHDGRRLTSGQKRLIRLRPKLTGYLSTVCACGCMACMPKSAKACSGCRRAYYATQDCQVR